MFSLKKSLLKRRHEKTSDLEALAEDIKITQKPLKEQTGACGVPLACLTCGVSFCLCPWL